MDNSLPTNQPTLNPAPTPAPMPTPNPTPTPAPEDKKANNHRVLIAAIIITIVIILIPVLFAVISFIKSASEPVPGANKLEKIDKSYYAKDVADLGFSVEDTEDFPVRCTTFKTKETYPLSIYGKSAEHCENVDVVVEKLGK